VAASLKLQEQNSLREQLFRGEKLAAPQLISGVASELQTPIGNILQLRLRSARMAFRTMTEAARNRIASRRRNRFALFLRHPDDSKSVRRHPRAAPSLMKFREPEWKTLELRVLNRVPPSPAWF